MDHEWEENIDFEYKNYQWKTIGDQLRTKSPIELKDNSDRL
jgi:hypothetical protein